MRISSDYNRSQAARLLSAADLFVTTVNRCAEAVPLKLLPATVSRDITVGVMLDRVPTEAEVEVSADPRSLLPKEGLGAAGLFTASETRFDCLGELRLAI